MNRTLPWASTLLLLGAAACSGLKGPPIYTFASQHTSAGEDAFAQVIILFQPALSNEHNAGYTLGINDRPIVIDQHNTWDRLPLGAGNQVMLPPDTYKMDLQDPDGDTMVSGTPRALEAGHTYTFIYYGPKNHLVENFHEDERTAPGLGLTRLRIVNTAWDQAPHDVYGWNVSEWSPPDPPPTLISQKLVSQLPFGQETTLVVDASQVTGVSYGADATDPQNYLSGWSYTQSQTAGPYCEGSTGSCGAFLEFSAVGGSSAVLGVF